MAILPLVLAGCSLSADASVTTSQANLISSRRATGWVRVGNELALPFSTTTCSAEPDRFVAVGAGMAGDMKFLVRVRARNVLEIRYGTHDELQADNSDVRQLVPTEPPVITAEDGVISGTAKLVDTAAPERAPVDVELRIYCG